MRPMFGLSRYRPRYGDVKLRAAISVVCKVELHKRLLYMKLGARVVAVETEDKMTDRQVMAKVRTHFGLGAPGAQSER